MPGKGGWTYIRLTDINQPKGTPFGMMRVKGTIDSYELSSCTLMPMGSGCLFLPVKAAIRKTIKKDEGDYVHLVLFKDDELFKVPQQLEERLKQEGVDKHFLKYKPWEQRMCSQWIFSAKRPETVNERIIKTIIRLKRNEKIV